MGTKYAGYFTSHADRKVEVDISNESYTGEVFPLSFSGDGVVITVPGKEIFDVMLSRGCEIFAFCTKKGEFSELFGTAERTWRVVVKYDNEVVFNGFVNPVMYTEDLTNVAHDVVIPCTDGLSQLEDYTPDLVIPSDSFVEIDNIIKACLLCTGLDLPVVYSSEIQTNKDDKKPIQNAVLYHEFLQENDGDLVKRKNAKQLLEEICTPFFWRLQQKGNSWCISRLCDIKKSVAKVIGTTSFPYVSVAPVATVDSGFGELTVQFEEKQFSGSVANTDSIGSQSVTHSQANGWYGISIGEIAERSISDKWVSIGVCTEQGYQSIFMRNGRIILNEKDFNKFPVCGLVYTSFQEMNTGEKFDISVKCNVSGANPSDNTCRLLVGVLLKYNNKYYYLKDGHYYNAPLDKASFYNSEDIELKNTTNGYGGECVMSLSAEYDDRNVRVVDIYVVIYPIFSGDNKTDYFFLHEGISMIDLKIKKSNQDTPKNTFRAINKSIKYLRVAPEVNIHLDTCQFFKDSQLQNCYFNNLLVSGVYLNCILDPVTNKEIPLHELVINDRMRQYERPTESVAVTVNMDHFLHTTEKIEIADRGKSYVINGAKYTLLEDDIQMDLKEIV